MCVPKMFLCCLDRALQAKLVQEVKEVQRYALFKHMIYMINESTVIKQHQPTLRTSDLHAFSWSLRI